MAHFQTFILVVCENVKRETVRDGSLGYIGFMVVRLLLFLSGHTQQRAKLQSEMPDTETQTETVKTYTHYKLHLQ